MFHKNLIALLFTIMLIGCATEQKNTRVYNGASLPIDVKGVTVFYMQPQKFSSIRGVVVNSYDRDKILHRVQVAIDKVFPQAFEKVNIPLTIYRAQTFIIPEPSHLIFIAPLRDDEFCYRFSCSHSIIFKLWITDQSKKVILWSTEIQQPDMVNPLIYDDRSDLALAKYMAAAVLSVIHAN